MDSINYRTCDVLITGSGLAGFRAGIAACSQKNDRDVLLITQGLGPSGSSFTNPNHALGIVSCSTDREKERFLNTAVAIAAPGIIDPDLTAVLADESEGMYLDLVQTGLSFQTNRHGKNRRHSACFLPKPRMAYVFTHLAAAFSLMKKRFLLHGQMEEGLVLVELVKNDENRIIGALFEDARSGSTWAIQCRALVMATGGAAGLFPRTLTDRKNLALPLALMHEAGAPMINMNYLQYIWYSKQSGKHWPCWQIADPNSRIRTPEGQERTIPESIRNLAALRSTHVPVAHGMTDSSLDHFLLEQASPDGALSVRVANENWQQVFLCAHALNGGVRIDKMGQTGLSGLFACGECAGGMHGANRVGGAMVLSSQVFGHRAGIAASRFARVCDSESKKRFLARVNHLKQNLQSDPRECQEGLARIRTLLAGSEGPFPRPDSQGRTEQIKSMAQEARDPALKRVLDCARLILEKSP